MSMDKEEIKTSEDVSVPEQNGEKRIGCAHYKRRAKFVVIIFL